MEHVNCWCFRGIYKGGLWENDLHVSAHWGWGYTHDRRADKYRYPHDRRADKDSYPHDRNVTDELCSFNETLFCIYYG